jgi:hypothetical protein
MNNSKLIKTTINLVCGGLAGSILNIHFESAKKK